jgi:hypothetical protein
MMKKQICLMGILLVGMLSACSGQQQSEAAYQLTATQIAVVVANQLTAAAPTQAPTPGQPSVEKKELSAGELSVGTQLLVGIYKLEGSDLAITKDQAMALFPLWSNLKTLLAQQTPSQPGGQGQGMPQAQSTPDAGNNEAQNQIQEILKDIQQVLSAEQINQIGSLNLIRNDLSALMQANQISTATPFSPQGGMGGGMGGGQPPDGGSGGAPTGGDASGGASGGTPPDMSSTPQAGQQMEQGEQIQTELLDLLIRLLQQRSQ